MLHTEHIFCFFRAKSKQITIQGDSRDVTPSLATFLGEHHPFSFVSSLLRMYRYVPSSCSFFVSFSNFRNKKGLRRQDMRGGGVAWKFKQEKIEKIGNKAETERMSMEPYDMWHVNDAMWRKKEKKENLQKLLHRDVVREKWTMSLR